MIRRVVGSAHGAATHVSVCGEMATRPDLGAALVALGVDALSVSRAIADAPQQPLGVDFHALGFAPAASSKVVADPRAQLCCRSLEPLDTLRPP